jgi:hypothetical protein
MLPLGRGPEVGIRWTDLSNTAAAGVQAISSDGMLGSRHEQMFPKFAPDEIDRLRRFGETRQYAAHEWLFRTGEIAPGLFVIIAGRVSIEARDRLNRAEGRGRVHRRSRATLRWTRLGRCAGNRAG